MEYFANDTQAVAVGGLNFENGLGELVLHGSVTLAPDAESLDLVRKLKARLSEIETAIGRGAAAYPEKEKERSPAPLDVVANPFAVELAKP